MQTPTSKDNDPDAMPMIPLRILLINTKVPKNTKVQVENVKKLVNLLPTVSEHILEAMDEVARTCLDTLTLLSNTTSKSIDGIRCIDKNENEETPFQLYHKLEVIIRTLFFMIFKIDRI